MPPTEHELRLRERLGRLRNLPLLGGAKISGELERLQRQIARIGEEATDEEIWRKVELARHDERPYTLDYVERLLDDWFELHGDRALGDDGAMIAGLGKLDGRTVVLVGQQKGRDIHERASRRFGMPNPEGYRKAWHAMEIADRHGFPVITLVDTPGAYPGVVAEQHGQGAAIAHSQSVMARLKVPTVTCVIGEGGSGGAIAIALADKRPHAGERDLLRHLAGGLRGDPLARRRPGEEGRGRVPPRRESLSGARRDRRDRARAGGRGAHRSGHGRAAPGGGAAGVARRARGDSRRRSAPPASCPLPVARRVRLRSL